MSLGCWIFPFIGKSDFSSVYKLALVSQPLATQCVVHGPAPSGSFPGMWDLRLHPRLPESEAAREQNHQVICVVCIENFKMH